jgi:hypothetical protein
MEEHDPAFPGVVQRPGQLLGTREHPEAALGIGVLVGIGLIRRPHLRFGGCGAGSQIDDCFGSLSGEVRDDHLQEVVVRGADIRDPLGRNAVAEQVSFREVGERPLEFRRCWGCGCGDCWSCGRCSGCWYGGDLEGDLNLTNRFADLDDLGGTRDGVGFNLAPRSPVVSRIMMVDVAEHHAALDPVKKINRMSRLTRAD